MKIGSISGIKATNYKNLRFESALKLNNLNVLIGPNGSGKSNLINILVFLKESLEEASSGATGFQRAINRLGSHQIADNTLTLPQKILVKVQWCVEDLPILGENEDDRLLWELGIYTPDIQRAGQLPTIHTEYMHSIKSEVEYPIPFIFYVADIADESIRLNLFDKENNNYLLWPVDSLSMRHLALQMMPDVVVSNGFQPSLIPAYSTSTALEQVIRQWELYNANNITVERIRGAENKIGQADTVVSPTGDNLVAVLHNLMQELDFEDQINEIMRRLFGESRRLRVRPFGRTHLGLEWWDSESAERPLFLDEMSDGTIRMLCWATILNAPKLPPLLILEEPEVGLHPAWLTTLAKWIKRASERTQVIMSTHSPDLLDKFTDSLESVIVFERDPESKAHNIVRRLTKERVAPFLEDGWELGDMYRVGEPAVGGWPW